MRYYRRICFILQCCFLSSRQKPGEHSLLEFVSKVTRVMVLMDHCTLIAAKTEHTLFFACVLFSECDIVLLQIRVNLKKHADM
jgi:hypothetical protein